MLQSIKNLGRTLEKVELKNITGGLGDLIDAIGVDDTCGELSRWCECNHGPLLCVPIGESCPRTC